MKKILILIALIVSILIITVMCNSEKNDVAQEMEMISETSESSDVLNPIKPDDLDDSDTYYEIEQETDETETIYTESTIGESNDSNTEETVEQQKWDPGVPIGGGTGEDSINSAVTVDEV